MFTYTAVPSVVRNSMADKNRNGNVA